MMLPFDAGDFRYPSAKQAISLFDPQFRTCGGLTQNRRNHQLHTLQTTSIVTGSMM
jgi:hypothetical protein